MKIFGVMPCISIKQLPEVVMEASEQVVSPKTALAVGLKVDAEALPAEVVAGIQSGAISLDDPASTIALLKLNSVLGVAV